MMTWQWKHVCKWDWLNVRRRYLTASDIYKLLPVTKNGNPRKITDDDYLRVFGNKLVEPTTDDCVSTGARARGHILEPYAIKTLNKKVINGYFYHWDDVIITNDVFGFSPDAMDIEMPKSEDCWYPYDHEIFVSYPISICEIKSYAADKHMVKLYSTKFDYEERWQIAMAMLTMPNIQYGHLVFYNPALPDKYKLYFTSYSRAMLAHEMDQIKKVIDKWKTFLSQQGNPNFGCFISDEDKIIEELQSRIADI